MPRLTEVFPIQGDLYMYQATTSQTSRAANLVRRMLKFKLLVDSQALEPMSINKTVPMCMTQVGVVLRLSSLFFGGENVCDGIFDLFDGLAQYKRLFSTTRIPGKECDEIVHLSRSDESRHVAVLANGSWFALDVFTSSGELLQAFEIEAQMERILAQAQGVKPSETEVRGDCSRHGTPRQVLNVTYDGRSGWRR